MRFVQYAVKLLEQEFAARIGAAGGIAAGVGRSDLALALEAQLRYSPDMPLAACTRTL